MPPIVHFIRHAQGYHNLKVSNRNIHDPLLTPFGKTQCELLAKTFPYTSSADLFVASPLKRAIYTTLYSFGDEIKAKNMSVVCVPEFQETSDWPCDTGSTATEIAQEFSGHRLDLSRLEPDWTSKTGKWAASIDAVEARSRVARCWLRSRKESHIVVVTHGGLLHYLTEDWANSPGREVVPHAGWENTEFRSYTFDAKSGDNASLIETEESRTRRRGLEKPLSEAEQHNLARAQEAQQVKEKQQQQQQQQQQSQQQQSQQQAPLREVKVVVKV